MGEMRGPVRHPGCGSKSQQRRRRAAGAGAGTHQEREEAPSQDGGHVMAWDIGLMEVER